MATLKINMKNKRLYFNRFSNQYGKWIGLEDSLGIHEAKSRALKNKNNLKNKLNS